jgi:hypothetical protein
MNNNFYQAHFEKLFEQIKPLRDSYYSPYDFNQHYNNRLVKLKDTNTINYDYIFAETQKRIYDSVQELIMQLLTKYNIEFKVIPKDIMSYFILDSAKTISQSNNKVLFDSNKYSNLFSLLIYKNNNTILYLFKDYGIPDEVINNLKAKLIETTNINDFKYIIYVDDYAYSCVLNHNQDENDPSRGTNLYSMQYFFETYFSIQEYQLFKKNLDCIVDKIKEYLSFSIIKKLSKNALTDFKKVVIHNLKNFPYSDFVTKHNPSLSSSQIQYLNDTFFNDERYLALVGKSSFSESFITAEWLLNSLDKAAGIDLTTVAIGYFKSIEQLLWHYILLYKNRHDKNGKAITIHKKNSRNYIELSDENIQKDIIDNSLGSIKSFFNFHKNIIFCPSIDLKTRNYVLAEIDSIKDIRNEYLHKNNITEWSTIETARKISFLIFYLVSTTFMYQDFHKEMLSPHFNDKFRLLDFIHSHVHYLYFIDDDPIPWIAEVKIIDYDKNGVAIFSDIILKVVGDKEHKQPQYIIKDVLPKQIFTVPLIPTKKGINLFEPKYLIFKDGKFHNPKMNENFNF